MEPRHLTLGRHLEGVVRRRRGNAIGKIAQNIGKRRIANMQMNRFVHAASPGPVEQQRNPGVVRADRC